MRRSSRLSIAVALAAMILSGERLKAQQLSANPPASCAIAPLPDSGGMTNGVMVRFAAGPGAQPLDALAAHAVGTRLSSELRALASAPVRAASSKADTNMRALDAAAMARLLESGERWIISGDVRETGKNVQVRWRIVDVRLGREVASGTVEDDLLWMPRLTGVVLEAVGEKIGVSRSLLAQARARQRFRYTTSREAMELYLAALYDVESFESRAQLNAIVALSKALVLDPTFSAAWYALGVAQVHAAYWGETARGRDQRLASAMQAANRALAVQPTDAGTLALLARVHLLRNEPAAATQALDALRSIAPRADEVAWLRSELARVRGDSTDAEAIIREAGSSIVEHVPTLFLRAEWERRRGRPQLACLALNRIVVLNETWAPAYVMRALVRSKLGDRRGGWADAEIVSRLGRPAWGAATTALIDLSMGDVNRVRRIARRDLAVRAESTLAWLDVLLRAAVFRGTNDLERAREALAAMPCDDYRRRYLAGDPLLVPLPLPPRCKVSRKPVASE
jgi:tetratricopeptide (TPR) repeat protein